MGYNTMFQLQIDGDSPTIEQVAEHIASLAFSPESNERKYHSTVDYLRMALDGEDQVKWYDYDADMRMVSEEWPGVLFTLNGEGEENGDIWRAYYRDGLAVTHRMPEWTPPAFDPADLS